MKTEELTISECLEIWISALEKKRDTGCTYMPKYGNKYIKLLSSRQTVVKVYAFVNIETKEYTRRLAGLNLVQPAIII